MDFSLLGFNFILEFGDVVLDCGEVGTVGVEETHGLVLEERVYLVSQLVAEVYEVGEGLVDEADILLSGWGGTLYCRSMSCLEIIYCLRRRSDLSAESLVMSIGIL